MHVLITSNTAWNIYNFRKPLVQALIADGHRITVLAPPDDAAKELQALGCGFRPLAMDAKGINPLNALGLVREMRRAFEKERPDIVLGFTIKNNLFGTVAAGNIPFIPNVTGLGTAFLSGRLLRFVAEALYRWAFAKVPVVFFQNEDDQKLFLSRRLVRPEQARLLPGSGIDLEYFKPMGPRISNSPLVFLMVARLLRDKGVVEFVEAAREVRRHHPNVRFQILGAVGVENRSAIDIQTLTKWQDEKTIEYLGVTSDVRPFIADADCVVLPSYREGAPRTLIEAGAMERPVIATDVPGCRSVVAAEVTGLLCAPRDAASLADACLRFIALPAARRAEMGRAGRQRMKDYYDQALVIDAYRAAIAEIGGAKATRSVHSGI
ncbi:glycosyltransferase family 4 protein [Paracoccus sp. (in: a-proteobacteria)]